MKSLEDALSAFERASSTFEQRQDRETLMALLETATDLREIYLAQKETEPG